MKRAMATAAKIAVGIRVRCTLFAYGFATGKLNLVVVASHFKIPDAEVPSTREVNKASDKFLVSYKVDAR